MYRPAIFVIVGASLTLAPLPTHAQPEGAPPGDAIAAAPAPTGDARARAAYQRGVAHFKAKRYAEAIGEFTRAQRMDPSPVLLFNIARAFEEWGNYEAAIRYYRLYLEAAPTAPDAKAVADGLPALERLAAQSQQGREVELVVTSHPDGATVFIDGREAGQTPLKAQVAPGKHFVVLERSGFARSRSELALDEAPVHHDVTLVSIAAPPPAGEGGGKVGAWVLIGVGGALLAGSAITGSLALGKSGELDDIDAGTKRSSRANYDGLQEDGQALAYATDGLLLGGLASATTGLVLLLTGDDTAGRAPEAAAMTPAAWR